MKKPAVLVPTILIILGIQLFSPMPGRGAGIEPRVDPLVTTTVVIEVDGKAVAYATAVKGIGEESEVVEMKSAGDSLIRKLPGRVKTSDIVIKKTMTPPATDFLYQWRKSMAGGGEAPGKLASYRKNGAIVFFDALRREIARYNFYNAWPSQWKGMAWEGQSPLPEEIVLTVERVERVR